MDTKVCVVIPAAGCGERMGIETPKQFTCVLNRPLISYTLEEFERVPFVEHIVVTVAAEKVEHMKEIVDHHQHKHVTVVQGGSTRHRSIFTGIKALSRVCKCPEIVVIHDGVRVVVDEETLKQVASAAQEHGAAGAIRPLVSTVIATNMEGFLETSLDRNKYRASEMPQAFKYDIIRSAYEQSTDFDLDYGTECLHLALKYTGTKVCLIDGPASLWKVTHKKDLYAVEGILKEKNSSVCIKGRIDDQILCCLKKAMKAKSMKICCCAEEFRCVADAKNVIMSHREDVLLSNSTEQIVQQQQLCNSIVHLLHNCQPEDLKLVSRKYKSNNIAIFAVNILDNISEDDRNNLGELVASIVFDRNMAFTGQCFTFG